MITGSEKENMFRLHGLLIDLESGMPDSSRFKELKVAICGKLGLRAPDNSSVAIILDHVHFSHTDFISNNIRKYDFMILSPQGSPWRSYTGASRIQLDRLGIVVVDAIMNSGFPALAICGGHQFLALSFGAEVDFIDEALAGQTLQVYPFEAVAERGLTTLETLRDDVIFEGILSHPSTFDVMESHTEEVKNTPHPFVNLARSALSEIQFITIPDTPVYGMAFHPERGWEHGSLTNSVVSPGKLLLGNFFGLVYRNRF